MVTPARPGRFNLSAAAIGEHHSLTLTSKNHVHDIGTLQAGRNRSQLCAGRIVWLDAVVNDSDYRILKNARDPVVHRKLPRIPGSARMPSGGQGPASQCGWSTPSPVPRSAQLSGLDIGILRGASHGRGGR